MSRFGVIGAGNHSRRLYLYTTDKMFFDLGVISFYRHRQCANLLFKHVFSVLAYLLSM